VSGICWTKPEVIQTTAEDLMMAELPMGVERLSAADQFEELYALYHEDINRYLYRLVDRADLASDLTQDTFIRLHRQLQGNVRLENSRAWLYRVATNLGYNHLRREQRLVKIIRNWLPLLNQTATPEREYARDEQRALARQAVDRLPVREQIMLQLFQDGLSYAEIAIAVNLNPASVGKLLSRAIEKCAQSVKR
jgi:RNA polymerase sigma factor (sigma-70 family)